MLRSNAMTIGQLSRRTGVPIKVLRDYEDLGFLYTLGRRPAHQPGPLHPPWCSCWRQTRAIVPCNLPLDSPLGGRVYTLSGAVGEIVIVSRRYLEQAEI